MGFEFQFECVMRILLAGICGILVGMERKNRAKEAGVRTHFIVACGAAIIMVISKYGFFDMVESGLFPNVDVRLDPSRVASTIASGIGFLGAGMIFVHKNTVTGLTTAAGIWATSGIGMAIGAGMYFLGIAATLIILFAQLVLHLNMEKFKRTRLKRLSVKAVSDPEYQKYLRDALSKIKVNIHDTSIELTDDEGKRNYVFILEVPHHTNEEEILNLVQYKCSIKSAN